MKYSGNFNYGVVVATMQSFSKIDPKDYCDQFPIVIVDEGHHISKFDGTYAKILSNMLSIVRLAFTATEPTLTEAKLALEGLIGPVIGDFTINEASEKGILAKPKIKIIKTDFDHSVRELRSYVQVYEEGIVQNTSRNKQIVDIALKHKEKGEVVLIFVNKIEQGENLINLFNGEAVTVPFVKGDMPSIEREYIKKSMIKKRRKIAIATTAWKEGINIPSLNVIINAAGGKSEISVLQSIGRGLRRTDDKEEVIIYDFFDPSHPHLVNHFGERITLYCEKEWL
jgi:superfamily II DNA or RNA helicase